MVNRDENTRKVESPCVSVDLEGSGFGESDKSKFKEFLVEFGEEDRE